jgi:dTDP-4-amino-4,6-dideoxygalactose transaminase
MTAGPAVPFVDLGWQWQQIAEAALPEIHQALATGAYSLGPAVARFETAFADYLGARHVIGVSNGTAALHLAAIIAGIGPGDEVLIPAHTFAATAWAALYVGAVPVLCDVDADTGLIDLSDAERKIGPRTRAVIPVHLYGRPLDLDRLYAFARRHGLGVIEDACQAHGASFGGQRIGAGSQLACFSFYPSKNLGSAGESGAVVTNDAAIADRLRALRNHAQTERYVHDELGFNYRMEGIQALVLLHKLRHLDRWTALRQAIADAYREGLRGLPLVLPAPVDGRHAYHLFVVRSAERDALRRHLAEHGIETGLHYPVPMHRQPCLAAYVPDSRDYKGADGWSAECLSLPIYPGMESRQVEQVIAAIRAFYRRDAESRLLVNPAEAGEMRVP